MKYTYLLINFFTVLFPVALSFDKRVAFYKTWRHLWPGMAVTGLLFLFWDVLFTVNDVWSFSNERIIGIRFYELPLEEMLFFLTVPFACVFIYACLNHYIKFEPGKRVVRGVSALIGLLCVAMLLLYPERLYTAVNFGLLLPIMLWFAFVQKAAWLGKFFRAYVVALLPFYMVNGLLTSIPVVLYNNAENMGFRMGTIPFEDHFYLMSLLLLNIGFYEYFKNKHAVTHG